MKKILVVVGIVAVLAGILFLHGGFTAATGSKSSNLGSDNNDNGKYDEFAKCLTEKGVKIYGSSRCSHCANQKAMFGQSWQFIDYVECTTPEGATLCTNAGVRFFPTWTFADGTRAEGETSLEALAAKTGCKLP